MLEVIGLSAGYNNQHIIKNINFTLKRGECLSIIGPNGCGKSTLLKCIGNLIDYDGEIKVDDVELRGLQKKLLAQKIALMSQGSQIYFPYTVYETVALGRYARGSGIFSSITKEDNKIILSSLEKVGLIKEKNKMINELSGGQLQRVFLARAFAQEPDILLLDEPTNHLDLKCQIELLQYVNEWTRDNNRSVIAVLHDLNLVQNFGERVMLMGNGKVVSEGKVKEVLSSEELTNTYNVDVRKHMIDTLEKWL